LARAERKKVFSEYFFHLLMQEKKASAKKVLERIRDKASKTQAEILEKMGKK
jgi:hypothetical protein